MKDIQDKTNSNSPFRGLGGNKLGLFLISLCAVFSASGTGIFQSWGKSYGLVSDIERSTDPVYKIYKKGLSEYQKSWLRCDSSAYQSVLHDQWQS